MSTLTYTTRSGSQYLVTDDMVRRLSADSFERCLEWTPYEQINRVPAATVRPGGRGEVLEIILASGECIITTPVTEVAVG